LRANESVAARIEELRARNAEKCQLSRDEAVQYLVEILKTPISEVTADHRLAQSYDPKSGKIELPNKLGAMQLLAKMCGWQAPEKHEIEHGYKAQQELISHRTAARAWSDTQQSECWISWRDRANAAFLLVRVRYWNSGATCAGSTRIAIQVRGKHSPRSGVSLSLAAEPRVRLAFMFRVALFAGKIEHIFRRWYPQSHGRAS
jgi:hypothetical protein